MEIKESQVTKLLLTDLDRLDPVSVFLEDFAEGQGQITILCYGKAWTSYWGGMGECTISEFFCSCDEFYISNKLSDIDSEIFDADKINAQADKIGRDYGRDEPWNDWDLMGELYGGDISEWSDLIPKKPNHEYDYLLRIIKAVQEALREREEAEKQYATTEALRNIQ